MNEKLRDLIMAIPPEKIDEVSSAIANILHGDLPVHKLRKPTNRTRVAPAIVPQSKVCPVCNQDLGNDNLIPVWNDLESTYTHAWCIWAALRNGWNEGHHNIIKRSHNSWLVFWRGKCAEVKTRREAKELLGRLSQVYKPTVCFVSLKQLNEGDSTKSGGTD